MTIGRLSISRGDRLDAPPSPRLALVPAAPPPPPPEAPPAGFASVNDRLDALERLVRLAQHGALSAEEFAAEKALVLGREAAAAPPAPSRRPSLLGRLLGWRLLPVGVAAGLAFSYGTQPQETLRFFDEALRLFGI